MFRLLITIVLVAALAYVAAVVPLGNKTLWQHVRAIAGSEASKELVDSVKEKARKALAADAGPEKKIEIKDEDLDNLTEEERAVLRKLIKKRLEKKK